MHDLKDILFNESQCKRYLTDKNVFYQELQCSVCGSAMKSDVDRWSFRCGTKACRKEVSMSKDTFFENSRLKVHQLTQMNEIMMLAYFWLNEVQWSAAVTMTGFAQKTVTRFYWLFRRLAATS